MARENPTWGYERIVGAMANLGYKVSDQTVGNILKRHDIPPAPKRMKATSWKDFIRTHMAVMVGTDFFTVEVLTLRGLKTYYVLFFLHLESRRIWLAGVTRPPDQEWMEQMARNVTSEVQIPSPRPIFQSNTFNFWSAAGPCHLCCLNKIFAPHKPKYQRRFLPNGLVHGFVGG
jgi:hypothetical protein